MKKSPHRQALGRGLGALLGEQGTEKTENLSSSKDRSGLEDQPSTKDRSGLEDQPSTKDHSNSEKRLSSTLQKDETLSWLRPETLQTNSKQPRVVFDEVSLDELGHSIRSKGILQPLLVRPCGEYRYEIIAGERRWRAAQLAGIEQIPCRILEVCDEEMMEIALLENIQRDDLNPIEEAKGYQHLIDAFSYTQEKLAHRIGKSRSHIANMLRILNLPESVQNLVLDKHLSLGHAKVILSSRFPEELAQKVIKNQWTVRQTEQELKKEQSLKKSQNLFEGALEHSTEALRQHLNHLEKNELELLERRLQTWVTHSQVKIQHKGASLEINLRFKNLEDMEHFISSVQEKSELP
ncbi:putative chromosome-partitioning protein ParB [Holospora elegans E1]|uniref:Putative chromosome-partitioning protein ParB n=1 Tax=Holospora elegans E1 TaxID=1427503 RepID=A0A023DX93_9PROT|nr:ParB/RepB/Spo0J family partition protein [Holospora elegans]GAJ45857.1 putative chromosome-partitioning protein ParB [Holospora elegans E1]